MKTDSMLTRTLKNAIAAILVAGIAITARGSGNEPLGVDPATGNLNNTIAVNFALNQFKLNGVAYNFGSSANQVPVLDGAGKLLLSEIPSIPVGTIGSTGAYSPNVVFEGDSITQQVTDAPGTPNGYNNYMGVAGADGVSAVPAIGTYNGLAVSPAVGQNVAVAGKTIEQLYETGARANALFRQETGMNVVVILAGTNNLGINGDTPALTYSKLEAYCTYLRQSGWRVIVLGLTSRGGSNGNGSYDSQVQTVNAYIRANWAKFADRFVDWNVLDTSVFGASGGYSNTTYYNGDQLHPTYAGGRRMASFVQPVINDLLTYYARNERNASWFNLNTTTHTGPLDAQIVLDNSNPSAASTAIWFKSTSSALGSGNIRNDYTGAMNYGAGGSGAYHAFFIGTAAQGPDVYGTNGSGGTNGAQDVFNIFGNLVQSVQPFQVLSASSAPTSGKGLELFFYSSLDTALIQSYDRTLGAWKGLSIRGDTLAFQTAGVDRLNLDSSGRISAANPLKIFSSNTTPATGTGLELSYNTTVDFGLISAFDRTGSTWKGLNIGASQIILATGGTNRWSFDSGGALNFTNSSNQCPVRFYSTTRSWGILQNNYAQGDFAIWQGTSGSADPFAGTTRLLIGLTGGVNIGGTNDPGAGILEVGGQNAKQGRIYFGNDASRYVEYIDGGGGVNAYNFAGAPLYVNGTLYTSSRTSKQDIRDWKRQTVTSPDDGGKTEQSAVQRLRPKTYAYKSQPDVRRVGFIAEDVRDAIPDAVITAPVDPKEPSLPKLAIDPMALIAAQVLEMQSLKKEIDELRALITEKKN